MFSVVDHDFGTVPRGSKAEFEFKFTNKYKEPVKVMSVRTSCNCTEPKIVKGVAKTYEDGVILCVFNTNMFVGQRAAVVTVVFDKPFYAEVQLTIKGNIRSDITPTPGEIQFGDVDLGTEKSTSVTIDYSGTGKWQIDDVRSANKHLSVKLEAVKSNKNQYVMNVRLKADAPAGELNDEITLVTNEAKFNFVTLPVRATIVPPLTSTPKIELGTLKTGSKLNNKIVVKAKQPFKIEKIDCSDTRFQFTPSTDEKAVHLISFEFSADAPVGAFRQAIKIITTNQEVTETIVTGNISD